MADGGFWLREGGMELSACLGSHSFQSSQVDPSIIYSSQLCLQIKKEERKPSEFSLKGPFMPCQASAFSSPCLCRKVQYICLSCFKQGYIKILEDFPLLTLACWLPAAAQPHIMNCKSSSKLLPSQTHRSFLRLQVASL